VAIVKGKKQSVRRPAFGVCRSATKRFACENRTNREGPLTVPNNSRVRLQIRRRTVNADRRTSYCSVEMYGPFGLGEISRKKQKK
jgi:hypothetical protein